MSNIDEQIEQFRYTQSNVPNIVDLSDLDDKQETTIHRRYIKIEKIGAVCDYYSERKSVRYSNHASPKNSKPSLPHATYTEASRDFMRYSYHEDLDQPVSYENAKRSSQNTRHEQERFVVNEVPFGSRTPAKTVQVSIDRVEGFMDRIGPVTVSVIVILILFLMIKVEYLSYQ